ncbi:MAG: Ig-like domain-containing protein, partial [Nitrospinae bacterium]|nr:Ig-like domain-containing protein [Nitrospinota bacterium]
SLAGIALENDYVWTFTTEDPPLAIAPSTTSGGSSTPAPSETTRPTVILTVPANGDVGVALNTAVTVTFSETMNRATLNTTSFTLKQGLVPVAGSVVSVGVSAVFTPTLPLTASTTYTATISTGATDRSGNRLAAPYVWSFTTGAIIDIIPPTVILTSPLDGATGVAINTTVDATFSEAMAPLSLTTLTYTLKQGLVAVGGSVLPAGANVVFTPTLDLAYSTTYTATITTGAEDLANNPMAAPYVWNFTTQAAPPPPVVPGIIDPYAIASAGGITNAGATQINGDVVLDPNRNCNAVDVGLADDFGLCGGFAPTHNAGDLVVTPLHPAGATTSAQVMAALLVKWNDISTAGMPGGTVLGCGTIGSGGGAGALIGCAGNFTLPPGVYVSATGSSIGVTGNLILDGGGDANATFVFQAPVSTLTTAPNATITLQNGAKASNVWWHVGSSATLGNGTDFYGNILASASISMGTSATSCGRLLSGASGAGAFTFLANTVSVPGHAFAPAGCN